MPQLDPSSFASQLIWLTITFTIFYLVMARIALPRISEVLETRQNRIAYDLETANSLKADAEKTLADYEASMASAHSEAQAMLAQAALARAAEASRRMDELGAKISAQLGDAEAAIQQAREAAMGNIDALAGDVARSAVAKLIGVEPAAGAVKSALDDVVKGSA